MQGAGGAIVVGSVFQSIIERTKLNQDVSDIYPEVLSNLSEIYLLLKNVSKAKRMALKIPSG